MIITLTGTNQYLIRQNLEAIIRQFREIHGGHSVEQFDAEQLEIAQLPELFQGVSLLAPQRLVIVRDASKHKTLWELLPEWLERLAEGVTLVIVDSALDKRTKAYKMLKKVSDFREFAELTEGELIRWLQQAALSMNGKLDAQRARYLLDRVGADQEKLQQELHKLVSYNPEITKQAIDELTVASPQANAFALLDAALGQQPELVRQTLAQLAAHEDPYKLFGLLVAQMQALAVVQSAANIAPEVIAREAGLHPFVVRKTQVVAARTSLQQLKNIIDALATCDDQLKSTGVDPWVLVGQCLGKIAARGLNS